MATLKQKKGAFIRAARLGRAAFKCKSTVSQVWPKEAATVTHEEAVKELDRLCEEYDYTGDAQILRKIAWLQELLLAQRPHCNFSGKPANRGNGKSLPSRDCHPLTVTGG